jgi:hypothetical protein
MFYSKFIKNVEKKQTPEKELALETLQDSKK